MTYATRSDGTSKLGTLVAVAQPLDATSIGPGATPALSTVILQASIDNRFMRTSVKQATAREIDRRRTSSYPPLRVRGVPLADPWTCDIRDVAKRAIFP